MLNQRIQELLAIHENDNVDKVILKYASDKDIDTAFLANQLIGRKKAVSKIPSWVPHEVVFPKSLAMEQCSSEITAQYKASLMQGKRLADLTGGFGVDTYFLSRQFAAVDYFEQNKELSEIAAYNFKVLDAQHIKVHQQDSINTLSTTSDYYDWIFVDPARRDNQQNRVFLLEDCTPDIGAHYDLLLSKTDNLLVKLSPILDIRSIQSELPNIAHIWVVAVRNECKEILVHCPKKAVEGTPKLTAVNITTSGEYEVYENKNTTTSHLSIKSPQAYIYEPNKAILKANLQDELAKELNISKLAAYSNFFTTDQYIADYPGRIFEQKAIVNAKPKSIKKYLDKGKANVIARNYPLKASQIYSKFKITPGSDTYLLATTLSNDKKVIIIGKRIK